MGRIHAHAFIVHMQSGLIFLGGVNVFFPVVIHFVYCFCIAAINIITFFFSNILTINHQLVSKPWIPCSFAAAARAFNWHNLIYTAHWNCCLLLIYNAFVLFQDILLSILRKPSDYQCFAVSTLLFPFHAIL